MIKIDIEMPIYCYDCPCHNGENGRCQISGKFTADKRPFDCPLIEVDKIPAADAEEVNHGTWVTITVPRHDPHGEKFWLCTNCEHMWRKELLVDVASGDFPKHCPECGAHMDAKEKDETKGDNISEA